MNLRKKPFSISLQALAGVLIFSCLLAHPFSEAASSPPGDKRDYMLVLNTYTESAPWSSHIINSIVAHIDQVDNFEVYTENMNSLLMTFKKHKTGEIESFKNNLLREYGKNPPRMLVLLGAPIAVLRDFVKQTWPGVPLILCSEMDYIGPENAYLDRRPLRPEERLPLCDKAVSDNITLIRTPLNAIVGFSSILAETDEEQEKREYISIIENNNALLLQLIGDILDLSKIEAGTLEFNFSDFELNELMHEKENIIRMKTAEGVELIFEPGLDACLFHSDRNRLSQLLINLLTNAAKFTAKGSIRFGYRTEGSRLRFYVSDTGCGIPPEGQRRIFDRFVKLNSFKQGTGLGLPICKSIVEHLGGEIGVKSEEGRGTTFWFTLPYVTGKPCETPCGEIPTVSVEKDKLTILIAEDNDSNYRLFETILRRDYRLIHARDGEQAVELCRTEHPHLILMDINMPVMNGYEAAAEIRKFAAEIPIVAVTAYAYASDEQKIMQNGFTGYMPKPINAPQLKKQILDILRERITLI